MEIRLINDGTSVIIQKEFNAPDITGSIWKVMSMSDCTIVNYIFNNEDDAKSTLSKSNTVDNIEILTNIFDKIVLSQSLTDVELEPFFNDSIEIIETSTI